MMRVIAILLAVCAGTVLAGTVNSSRSGNPTTGTYSVGTTSGTVAAGDDSRITGALQKSSNLSDLNSASTARTNLGLGSAAVLAVATGRATCNGTTEVTVTAASVTTNSNIFFSVQAPGGTVGGLYYVSSRSAGASFGFKCAALDTSTVAWVFFQ